MAFTPLYGTGFEQGTTEIVPSTHRTGNQTAISGSNEKTGDYCYRIYDDGFGGVISWIRFPTTGSPTDLYVAVWYKPVYGATLDERHRVQVVLDNGDIVDIRTDVNNWDAFVDGVKVASGTVSVTDGNYYHVQVHFVIDNSGSIDTIINGEVDISYSGDTLPSGASHISYVRLYVYGQGDSAYVDDFVYGTDGWPGDIRFDVALVPDADTDDVDWTPSSGSVHYAMIDEIPLNDSDYVSAGSDGYRDMYGLSDWSPAQSGEPQFLVQWIRAKSQTADSPGIDIIMDSNGTEESSGSITLSTSWAYFNQIVTTNPDGGGAWNQAAINALEVGQEVMF